MFIDSVLLFPYYLTLKIRNSLYDNGTKKSYSYDIPIISVGNITVGGTGKTPHAEMLIRLLKDRYRIVLISRGYKRKGSGYREVLCEDSYKEVGDEPLQIKRKFPEIKVIVDANRKRAIDTLAALPSEERPTLIILDDAFQHRRITPLLSILLVDYSRPIFEDRLIPMGKLRDLPQQIKRADAVIVTKVPELVDEPDTELWRRKLHLGENTPLFFSKVSHKAPLPFDPEHCDVRYAYSKTAIYFSGIASDVSLRNHLLGQYKIIDHLQFADHHDYSSFDLHQISNLARKHSTAALFTTEKDVQRLYNHKGLTDEIRHRLLYIPIEPSIIPDLTGMERVIEEEKEGIGMEQFSRFIYNFCK